MIFDTHCHGYWHGLAHRQAEVQNNMRAAGVTRTVQIGTDINKSRESLEIARNWGAGAWCAVGIHPTGCQDLPGGICREYMDALQKIADCNRDKVVGIGETGFDFYHLGRGDKERQKARQREFFLSQADLALRLDLPLIIHTRDAAAETLALIKESGIRRMVIHCFSETLAFARDLLNWCDDVYFSFSGILTYRKATAVQDAARALRLDRLLVETDAPFLVPQAVRNMFTINEPAFVGHILDFLKTLRPEPGSIVEQTVWENSNRFFRLE